MFPNYTKFVHSKASCLHYTCAHAPGADPDPTLLHSYIRLSLIPRRKSTLYACCLPSSSFSLAITTEHTCLLDYFLIGGMDYENRD